MLYHHYLVCRHSDNVTITFGIKNGPCETLPFFPFSLPFLSFSCLFLYSSFTLPFPSPFLFFLSFSFLFSFLFCFLFRSFSVPFPFVFLSFSFRFLFPFPFPFLFLSLSFSSPFPILSFPFLYYFFSFSLSSLMWILWSRCGASAWKMKPFERARGFYKTSCVVAVYWGLVSLMMRIMFSTRDFHGMIFSGVQRCLTGRNRFLKNQGLFGTTAMVIIHGAMYVCPLVMTGSLRIGNSPLNWQVNHQNYMRHFA